MYGFLFSRNNSIGTISATTFLRRVTGQQKDESISLSKQCAFLDEHLTKITEVTKIKDYGQTLLPKIPKQFFGLSEVFN